MLDLEEVPDLVDAHQLELAGDAHGELDGRRDARHAPGRDPVRHLEARQVPRGPEAEGDLRARRDVRIEAELAPARQPVTLGLRSKPAAKPAAKLDKPSKPKPEPKKKAPTPDWGSRPSEST